jgi:hypothetical protein
MGGFVSGIARNSHGLRRWHLLQLRDESYHSRRMGLQASMRGWAGIRCGAVGVGVKNFIIAGYCNLRSRSWCFVCLLASRERQRPESYTTSNACSTAEQVTGFLLLSGRSRSWPASETKRPHGVSVLAPREVSDPASLPGHLFRRIKSFQRSARRIRNRGKCGWGSDTTSIRIDSLATVAVSFVLAFFPTNGSTRRPPSMA